MPRFPRPARPGRRTRRLVLAGALAAAVVTAAALTWGTAWATFTVTTPTYSTTWSTGTVALADDDAGSALFSVTGLAPGAAGTRCIAVTSTGSVPALVHLYVSARTTTKSLSSALTVAVVAGTGGSAARCADFTPATTVYRGTLAAFPSSWATGVDAWTTTGSTAGETRTYLDHLERPGRGVDRRAGRHGRGGLHVGGAEHVTAPPAPWRQGWPVLAAGAAARFVLACLLLLVAASVLPAAWGWQSTVVVSGSMESTLHPGDVVVVRPVPAAQLTAGRIVLVDDPDLTGSLRAHRIVSVDDGRLRLRGDANPAPDTSLVPIAAVHGVGALRFPALGLPALWLRQHRLLPVTGTAAVLAALVALALLHRSAGAEDAPRRRVPMGAPRALAVAGVGLLVAALPSGATPSRAVFSGTATNAGNSLAAAAAWSCAAAVGAAGATEYYPLQESAGTTATNAGTWGSSANATYSASGVTYGARGPRCAVGQQSAVTLDGANGAVWTPAAVTNPQTFSEQIWFATTTATGGKLIGFGDGTGGAQSGNYDRHIYMTNSG